MIAHNQLVDLGLTPRAIKHRLSIGRLHRVYRGVYSAGRPELTGLGRWMAAVLACGPGAVLSGRSAAELWGILKPSARRIQITVPPQKTRSRPGVTVKSRHLMHDDVTTHHGVPLTSPVRTLIDLATTLRADDLERAVNQADKLDLVYPETLRTALGEYAGVPGARKLRLLLDRRTFTLTDSPLEQAFLPIVKKAGLPQPRTQQRVNGFRVDFYWADLGLVVETDGLRYHRTPAQQAKDHERDQAHAAAGLTALRFTHSQIRFDPDGVARTLQAVARRLAAQAPYAA